MYRIIVGEWNDMDRQNHRFSLTGRNSPIAASACRISALSSADFCLRDRKDVAWGRILWRGNKGEIRRLFEAERLDGGKLEALDGQREYSVMFLSGAFCA